VNGPIPAHAEYDTTAKAHVIYTAMYSYNFGHLIPDEFAGIFRLLDMFDAVTNDLRVVEISDFTFMLSDVQKAEPCFGYYKKHFPAGIPKGLFAWCSGVGEVDPSKAFLAPLRNTCDFHAETGTEWNEKHLHLCGVLRKKWLKSLSKYGEAGQQHAELMYRYRGSKGTDGKTAQERTVNRVDNGQWVKKGKGQHAAPWWGKVDEALRKKRGGTMTDQDEKERLVCFKDAYAGVGYLTGHCSDWYNHGKSMHNDMAKVGQVGSFSASSTCNVGRGKDFVKLRDFQMTNVGLDAKLVPCNNRILFSVRGLDGKFTKAHSDSWYQTAKEVSAALGIPASVEILGKVS
jgi:hypothetical protein